MLLCYKLLIRHGFLLFGRVVTVLYWRPFYMAG